MIAKRKGRGTDRQRACSAMNVTIFIAMAATTLSIAGDALALFNKNKKPKFDRNSLNVLLNKKKNNSLEETASGSSSSSGSSGINNSPSSIKDEHQQKQKLDSVDGQPGVKEHQKQESVELDQKSDGQAPSPAVTESEALQKALALSRKLEEHGITKVERPQLGREKSDGTSKISPELARWLRANGFSTGIDLAEQRPTEKEIKVELKPVPPLTGNLTNYPGLALPYTGFLDQLDVKVDLPTRLARKDTPWGLSVARMGKAENRIYGYEDAFATDPLAGIFVVADGATEAAASGKFSRLLVEKFARGASTDGKGFSAVVKEAMVEWQEQMKSRMQNMNFFAREKLKQGPASTVLILKATKKETDRQGKTIGTKFKAVATGDTAVLHIRNGEVIGAWPFTSSADFNVTPPLILGNSAIDENRKIAAPIEGEFVGLSGDTVLLVTDAVAKWALTEVEQDRSPVGALLGIRNKRDMARFVKAHRSSEARPVENSLKNDDLTIMRIDVPSEKRLDDWYAQREKSQSLASSIGTSN